MRGVLPLPSSLPLWALLASRPAAAEPPRAHLEDWGDQRGDRVILVMTPGYAEPAWQALAEALETAGLDVQVVDVEVQEPDPGDALAELLRQESLAPGWQETALVAHGVGGRLLVEALEDLPAPRAVGLLGVPLDLQPVALTSELAGMRVPAGGMDLAGPEALAARWRGLATLPLLLGEPLPPLERVGAGLLVALQGDLGKAAPLDLTELTARTAVWVGVGDEDNLAPPEAVRPWLGSARFVRFGPLRGDGQSFDSADLLSHPRPLRSLARWLIGADEPPEEPAPRAPAAGGAP